MQYTVSKSSIEGLFQSSGIFCQRSSFAKVVFSQRPSFVKCRLPSTVVFRKRSSYAKGRPLSKVRLSSKVVFHQIICRDSPKVVHFICRDSTYIVYFKLLFQLEFALPWMSIFFGLSSLLGPLYVNPNYPDVFSKLFTPGGGGNHHPP